MSSAIEVLKSKKSICDLCKYDNNKSCDASGGEFGECKPADDFYKAIQEAIVDLKKQENKVCIPLDKVRDLFVEMENYLDFSEGHCKSLRKKVGELKQQVYLETHKVRK